MQSILIYIVLFGGVLLVAKSAELTNDRKLAYGVIAILSLVAGLRAETVGIDTAGYLNAIEHIIAGRLEYAYGMEWSFRFICYAISFVIKEPQIFMIIFALVTNTLIVTRLWELKNHISFTWAIFAYYSMFYMMSMNVSRQFIAIAIVFYCSKYLLAGKNIKFVFGVVIASLFHQTALISILLIWFNVVNWNNMNRAQRRFFVFVTVLSPISIIYVQKILLQYSGYLKTREISIGFMIIVKMIILLLTVLTLNQTENICEDNTKLIRFSRVTLICGLLLTSLGYIFRFADRIGLYFYVFESIYVGNIFKQINTRNNFIIKMMITILFAYLFVSNTLGNGQGQNPYLFFWQ
jgi:hypothetical protein